MIPYFEQPFLRLGPLTIHAFGVAVAIAVVWGVRLAERDFRNRLLDQRIGGLMGWWVLAGGILGAHLFSVFFYFPHKLMRDPWLLLRLWEDISSFGGMLGGIAGALCFFRFGAGRNEQPRQTEYLGTIAKVFPVSLAVGRFGCTLAHDHPGTVTTFPLAISIRTEAASSYIAALYRESGAPLPSSAVESRGSYGFHDLGWYEFLFLSLVVVPLFHLWQRRDRPGGFYLIAFPLVYLPVRFGFDFLRIVDVRYAGLTPAQWVSLLAVVGLSIVVIVRRSLTRS